MLGTRFLIHRIREFLSVLEGLVGIYDPLHSQNQNIKITSLGDVSYKIFNAQDKGISFSIKRFGGHI